MAIIRMSFAYSLQRTQSHLRGNSSMVLTYLHTITPRLRLPWPSQHIGHRNVRAHAIKFARVYTCLHAHALMCINFSAFAYTHIRVLWVLAIVWACMRAYACWGMCVSTQACSRSYFGSTSIHPGNIVVNLLGLHRCLPTKCTSPRGSTPPFMTLLLSCRHNQLTLRNSALPVNVMQL